MVDAIITLAQYLNINPYIFTASLGLIVALLCILIVVHIHHRAFVQTILNQRNLGTSNARCIISYIWPKVIVVKYKRKKYIYKKCKVLYDDIDGMSSAIVYAFDDNGVLEVGNVLEVSYRMTNDDRVILCNHTINEKLYNLEQEKIKKKQDKKDRKAQQRKERYNSKEEKLSAIENTNEIDTKETIQEEVQKQSDEPIETEEIKNNIYVENDIPKEENIEIEEPSNISQNDKNDIETKSNEIELYEDIEETTNETIKDEDLFEEVFFDENDNEIMNNQPNEDEIKSSSVIIDDNIDSPDLSIIQTPNKEKDNTNASNS